MNYRPEIDGLRAIAVIPVILFHMGSDLFSGGFVGVDVFFVISGYLITSIILSEIMQGNFSLIHFYERRVRRILPALFLVILVCLPLAWMLLMPSDMLDFSKSLVSVATFSSNLLFWKQSGYWGTVNELKPLLHTWSLAVEEQYYLVFPLFLLLMWRYGKPWILHSFILIALASLTLSQVGLKVDQAAVFFLLPSRGWEIALGAIIAYLFLYRRLMLEQILARKLINEVLSILGLGMIIYAVFAFSAKTPFPGLYALLPTLGTSLIIVFSSQATCVRRCLSFKPLVSIGLISYSAYLWHQPLFAFARHASLSEPSSFLLASLATLSFLLAFISWKYIETPFRTKDKFSRKTLFSFALIMSLTFIIIGFAGIVSAGFSERGRQGQLSLNLIDNKLRPDYGLSKTCEGKFTLSPACRTSDQPEIMVWGDSYAMFLVHGILASKADARIIQMTKSVCGPFFNIAPVYGPEQTLDWAQGCLDFNANVHAWLKENHTIKYVVLSSPFIQYLLPVIDLKYRDGHLASAGIPNAVSAFKETLTELISLGIQPVIFSPPPANDINLGRCLARADRLGINLDRCNFPTSKMSQSRETAYAFLRQIEKEYKVIQMDKFLCNHSECVSHIGDTYLFRDYGHLSIEGVRLLGKRENFYQLITTPTKLNSQ